MDSDEEREVESDLGHHNSSTDHDEESSENVESTSEKDRDSFGTISSLTGFLFGNIDEKGQLEEDFLDEESKRHLSSLTQLGIGSMVKEIAEDAEVTPEQREANIENYESKSPSAIDFSDITETAEDEENLRKNSLADDKAPIEETEEKVAAEDDRKLMPPPSWLPSSTSQPISVVTSESWSSSADDETSPSKRLHTPLADMMPPELANVDVTSIFPQFRHGQVLRFSRLFKPAHAPHIWRKKRKKKEDEEEDKEIEKKKEGKDIKKKEEKSSKKKDEKKQVEEKTEKEKSDKDEEQVVKDETDKTVIEEESPEKPKDDEGVSLEKKEIDKDTSEATDAGEKDKDGTKEESRAEETSMDVAADESSSSDQVESAELEKSEDADDEGEEDEEEEELRKLELKLALNFGRAPKSEELMEDEEDILMRPLTASDSQNQAQDHEQEQNVGVAPWRYGPAQYWYDSLGVDETGRNFSYNFKLKSEEAKQAQKEESTRLDKDLDYDRFLMVTQQEWEDKIIWDGDEVRQKVLEEHKKNAEFAGWVPSTNNRTFAQSRSQTGVLQRSKSMISKNDVDPKRDGEWYSIFPIENEALIYKNWEDDIIWDAEVPSAVNAKDVFNLSNDEYYSPKQMDNALRPNIGSSVIQHSTPAAELRQPFFPTHVGHNRLRTFHRPPLKKYSHGPLATFGAHPVQSLIKVIKRKAKSREQERQAFGGGEIFFMRTPQDLTGMDGELILAEYSEEFPPLMNQVGMASKIKNYYKRKPGKDSNPPTFKYGELAYAHTSPFIGALKPGNCQQALENNMFRSPIYEHGVPQTDFLIIRTRHGYFVRDVETIYTVGQQGPLMEVPGPNSKRSNNFVRDFLQVFIYRLFWKSKDEPRRIKMEDIKRAFSSHSESSIRKRLKLCADFKRTGIDSNWWVLKPDFRLPTEEEIRAMVSPEQCCAWYSLTTAEQRLKDAGYGEKSLFSVEEENEEDAQTKIDDEIRAAPWNTTRAYISAMKGKCLLQLTGLADPTGCGEGFSYIKVPNKPQTKEEARETPVKKTVTGTDADLRRLNLQDAKQLLRKFGVHESEIKKLSRWEVIDVVRTMSTQQAKQGQDTTGWVKFARGNRYSAAEHMERYKEECQRIFELQNRVLASTETLSTDEESTSGEDSDFEEMGKNIESMLSNKKTSTQLTREKEEAERRELQRMLKGEPPDAKDKKIVKGSKEEEMMQHRGRKLKIVRTFHDDTGRQYQRSEMVSNPVVIDTYLRIRETRDQSFIKQFAAMDDQQKEEMRKERRRIQEQLRRIKRNQEKPAVSTPPPKKKPKKEKEQLIKASKMKCGACGQIGHMRTNKECPNYLLRGPGGVGAVNVAMTEEQEEEEVKNVPADQDLINVEGTKIIMSKTLLEHAESIRRKALVLKVPKQAVETKKKKRVTHVVHCDYLKKPKQSSNRRRTDPLVTLSSILETILNELRNMPDIQLFLFPVNQKEVPDYYRIIKRPMDMQTMRENVRQKKYRSREDFLADLNQIVENSKLYNGAQHLLTKNAQAMLAQCFQRFAEKEQKLMRLEKAINPLLDDNDQVALSYIFEKVVNSMKGQEASWPFHAPVNKKTVKDYYNVIKKPMDLTTLLKNVQSHKYHSKAEFVEDAELLYTNSLQYNGADHNVTSTARKLMEIMKEELGKEEERITQLEADIRAVQEAALEAADTDSMTGASLLHDDASIMGADTESIDGQSVGAKDNITIAEEENSMALPSYDDTEDYSKNTQGLSDSEFVDIEGDEENASSHRQTQESLAEEGEEEDDLAKDLQLSDGEEEEEDEEEEDVSIDTMDEETQDKEDMDVDEAENLAENSQSFYDSGNMPGEAEIEQDEEGFEEVPESGQQEGMSLAAGDEEEEMGDSFDPSEFFKNSALASAQAEAQATGGVDIVDDLQISDDSDEGGAGGEGGEDEEDPYPIIPTENQDAEGFDIDEFL
ncbi:transcription initiation factor tfiid subunit [Plakobranchus ocellatus]|uniref:Transcription initiation factor TFIID subunit 1 n=1 Tax=Plakobranchus ocellatus TaxID=259542 RepID=A0AAV4CIG8_9GAST|nr:transcription initiation factor tfiid subunit [Plakobranchus ocellatus]